MAELSAVDDALMRTVVEQQAIELADERIARAARAGLGSRSHARSELDDPDALGMNRMRSQPVIECTRRRSAEHFLLQPCVLLEDRE